MLTAMVLIQAERTQIAATAERIARIRHVSEVYSVTGEWDIVAMLKLPTFEHLDEVVTLSLRSLEGIVKTQTLLAFRTYSPEQLDSGFSLGLEG